MEIVKLYIIENDIHYVSALTRMLSELYPGLSIKYAYEFNSEDSALYDSDVLLLDEVSHKMLYKSLSSGVQALSKQPAIILLDTETKYIGCRKLMELAGVQEKQNCKVNGFSTDATRIDFISSRGGVGTSSIALSVANELAVYRNRKVVYLSRESFENPLLYMYESVEPEMPLSHYLFSYLRNKLSANDSKELHIPITEPAKGLYKFTPGTCRNALATLSDLEFDELATQIVKQTNADFLIIDRGTLRYSSVEDSQHVYIANQNDAMLSLSQEKFRSHFGLEATDKLTVVRNIHGSDERGHSETSENIPESYLTINSNSTDFIRSERGISININGTFGSGIKRLVDLILEEEEPDVKKEN
jgi:hypothetical protein